MKKQIIRFGALGVVAVSALGLVASSPSNVRFKVADPVALLKPAMSDSVDNNGTRYEDASMLDNRVATDFKRLKSQVVESNDSGMLTLPQAGQGTEMRVLSSNMRAERFAKGKLKVVSPEIFEVLIDGKSVMRKTTAEDSITAASAKTANITLEPEHDYGVIVKLIAGNSESPSLQVSFVADDEFESVPVSIDSEMKRRFNVDNCVEGTRIRNTSMSSDGKYVICRYSQYFNPKKSRRWARVYETSSRRIVADGLQYDVDWMPGSNKLYYTMSTEEGYDVFTISVPDMKQDLLMSDIETSSFYFSPDGKYIIYDRAIEGEIAPGPMRRFTNPDDRIPGNRDISLIIKHDVATGNTQTLTYGARKNMILDISPDSKKLLYMSARETPEQWPFYANSIIEMDLTTLATDTIIKEQGMINSAGYSPDGKQLLLIGGPNMLDGVAKNCGNHPIANDFDLQGVIYDIATGKMNAFTRDFDPSLGSDVTWNAVDGNIYFTGVEGFCNNLYRYNPKTDKFTKLAAAIDYVRNYSLGSREDRVLSYAGCDLYSDGMAYLLDLKSGKSTLIDNPLSAMLDDIQLGTMEKWTFTASDGTEIDGDLNFPPNFDPNKKYPLIVYYYGGTTPSTHSMSSPYQPAVLASRDYIVYVINPSGTIGYGQEFSARHVNAWGKRTAEDIIEGVKELCKTHPYIDADKIGCMGASYGGFMTQYLQTLTDIFACAVSHAGISNLTSYWGEGYWGYSYNSVAAAQSYPWNNPKLFTEQGSLFNADKIHTPLLLLHGNQDTNVPMGESIQLFNALKILGRDVEFITVDGQDHIITDIEKRRLWQNTIMAWFEKYLKDDPSWWNSLYGK